MTAASPDERALLARARAGDREAFSLLVERHRGAVYRFAERLLAGASGAEDVLQETFLTAMAHLSEVRGDGSVRPWLYAIARSKVWQQRRRRLGQPARWEPVESVETLARDAGFGAPLTPEELTSRVERQALLEAALTRLVDEEREVVVLRDVEGMSGEETAAALELSLPAMKSRLHRGRLHLLAALKKEGLS